MAQPTDLMGLGENPFMARRVGTTLQNNVSVAGSTLAAATAINSDQSLVMVTTSVANGGCVLPTVGGDTGCLLTDLYTIHNGTANTINVYTKTGVTLNVSAAQFASPSAFSLTTFKTLICQPTSATQWIGLLSN